MFINFNILVMFLRKKIYEIILHHHHHYFEHHWEFTILLLLLLFCMGILRLRQFQNYWFFKFIVIYFSCCCFFFCSKYNRNWCFFVCIVKNSLRKCRQQIKTFIQFKKLDKWKTSVSMLFCFHNFFLWYIDSIEYWNHKSFFIKLWQN